MKNIFTILILLLSTTVFSQAEFQEGYYINATGTRIEGFIKIENWKSNPKKFTFKPSEMGPEKEILAKNTKGFGAGNAIQYDLFTVKISKSSEELSLMDRVKAFDLTEETAMLKLLVDGEAQLYLYRNQGFTQYFIKKDGLITTLLYKKYLLNGGVATNNQYKQQISNLLSCDTGKLPAPEDLEYTLRSLENFVRTYNECNGSLNTTFEVEKIENKVVFKVFGGAQSSSLEVDGTENRSFDFGNQTSFIPGIEMEIQFPFKNKNMFSIFFDARRHTFESVTNTPFTQFPSEMIFFRETKALYEAIDVGIGTRYYVPLGVDSNIFFGVNSSIDVIGTREITYDNVLSTDIEGNAATVILGLGVGYNWKNLSAEVRVHTNRDISDLERESATTTSYSNIAFTISYSFLKLSL